MGWRRKQSSIKGALAYDVPACLFALRARCHSGARPSSHLDTPLRAKVQRGDQVPALRGLDLPAIRSLPRRSDRRLVTPSTASIRNKVPTTRTSGLSLITAEARPIPRILKSRCCWTLAASSGGHPGVRTSMTHRRDLTREAWMEEGSGASEQEGVGAGGRRRRRRRRRRRARARWKAKGKGPKAEQPWCTSAHRLQIPVHIGSSLPAGRFRERGSGP
ncbi:hypothetical protein BP5796_07748 [Coleophoma crateriformis]|uniref:Uncharacterized protein n=1 Tax=Coleophoma crateriformis TaxID=565419 RepID=A0A3D8RCW5_9HELO|nr:hypothetical protein BP5796_07748 [Coleophoma crateriformis]